MTSFKLEKLAGKGPNLESFECQAKMFVSQDGKNTGNGRVQNELPGRGMAMK